jgi:toxin YoeB
MDMMFNELSTEPIAATETIAYNRIDLLINTYKKASELEFNRIRFENSIGSIELAPGFTIHDYCCKDRIKGTLLRGLARYPYIEPDTEEERRYLMSKFTINKNGQIVQTYGLAVAWLYNTIGIGFQPEDYWKNLEFEITITGEETQTSTVICATEPANFNTSIYLAWQSRININRLEDGELLTELFSDYTFEQRAIEDIQYWTSNLNIKIRLYKLLNDIKYNPFSGGIGKTEPLLGISDTFSKRIDEANRIVYKINTGRKVQVLSCRGHYI